jgi:hypothetical protein
MPVEIIPLIAQQARFDTVSQVLTFTQLCRTAQSALPDLLVHWARVWHRNCTLMWSYHASRQRDVMVKDFEAHALFVILERHGTTLGHLCKLTGGDISCAVPPPNVMIALFELQKHALIDYHMLYQTKQPYEGGYLFKTSNNMWCLPLTGQSVSPSHAMGDVHHFNRDCAGDLFDITMQWLPQCVTRLHRVPKIRRVIGMPHDPECYGLAALNKTIEDQCLRIGGMLSHRYIRTALIDGLFHDCKNKTLLIALYYDVMIDSGSLTYGEADESTLICNGVYDEEHLFSSYDTVRNLLHDCFICLYIPVAGSDRCVTTDEIVYRHATHHDRIGKLWEGLQSVITVDDSSQCSRGSGDERDGYSESSEDILHDEYSDDSSLYDSGESDFYQ